MIFGLRELDATEMVDMCSTPSVTPRLPVTDRRATFSSNYELRLFTSGCYYLDANHQWQADGLVVGRRAGGTYVYLLLIASLVARLDH